MTTTYHQDTPDAVRRILETQCTAGDGCGCSTGMLQPAGTGAKSTMLSVTSVGPADKSKFRCSSTTAGAWAVRLSWITASSRLWKDGGRCTNIRTTTPATTKSNDDHEVARDGETVARFKSHKQAVNYVAYMLGQRSRK